MYILMFLGIALREYFKIKISLPTPLALFHLFITYWSPSKQAISRQVWLPMQSQSFVPAMHKPDTFYPWIRHWCFRFMISLMDVSRTCLRVPGELSVMSCHHLVLIILISQVYLARESREYFSRGSKMVFTIYCPMWLWRSWELQFYFFLVVSCAYPSFFWHLFPLNIEERHPEISFPIRCMWNVKYVQLVCSNEELRAAGSIYAFRQRAFAGTIMPLWFVLVSTAGGWRRMTTWGKIEPKFKSSLENVKAFWRLKRG